MNPSDHRQKKTKLRLSTQRHIQREIYLPLIFGILLIVGLSIYFWPQDDGSSVLADAAVICLTLPIFLLGLLTIVVLGFAAFATEKVIQKLPAPFRKVQQFLGQVEGTAKRTGNLAAKPMIDSLSAWAGFKAFLQGITTIFRSDEGNLYE